MDAFKHVNNAAYLTYLEECRDEWLACVLSEDFVNQFVIARVAVDYRSQVTQADDIVEVALEVTRVGSSSVTTRETITVPSDGRLAVEADAVLVHIDWKSGGSKPLSEELRRQIQSTPWL